VDITSKIEKYSNAVAALESKHDKLQGRYEASIEAMQEEFGVSDLDEAAALLEEKETEVAELKNQQEEDIAEFEELYGHLL